MDENTLNRIEDIELRHAEARNDLATLDRIYAARRERAEAKLAAAEAEHEKSKAEAAKEKAKGDLRHSVRCAAERLCDNDAVPSQADAEFVVNVIHAQRGWKIEPDKSKADVAEFIEKINGR